VILFAREKPIVTAKNLGEATVKAKAVFFRGQEELSRGDNIISGNLWEIDTRLTPKLDKHFGYNLNDQSGSYFHRRILEVTTLNGEKKTAWVYLVNDNLKLDPIHKLTS